MTDPILFAIGVLVTLATVTAVVLVGQAEAEDPALNRSDGASDGG